MPSQTLSSAFEDRVFSIIQSTSFKGLLNSNRIEDKKIIAEYYEKIEIFHLAIEVYLSLRDYDSVSRLLQKGKNKIGKKFDRYVWECEVFEK
ncbi:MAG: hypothetical protein AABX54_04020 [Nanoarchaeota archaeon]